MGEEALEALASIRGDSFSEQLRLPPECDIRCEGIADGYKLRLTHVEEARLRLEFLDDKGVVMDAVEFGRGDSSLILRSRIQGWNTIRITRLDR